MGYDTVLLFVTGNGKNGFQHIEATLKMGCICYNEMANLIETTRKSKTETNILRKEIEKVEEEANEIYNSEGNYTEEMSELDRTDRKKLDKILKKYYSAKNKLEKKMPFVYYTDYNKEQFEDSYGDLLMVVEPEELKKAIIKSNATDISSGNHEMGYRRFDIAIRMIEAFQSCFGEKFRIVLWGD